MGKKYTADNFVTTAGADLVITKADLASPTFTGTVTVPSPINQRNVANTFTSLLSNTATAPRAWNMPDKDGVVAMISDVTVGGGGANGRLYYPQNSVASDLTGYKVASLTPSAGVTSNVSIVCPTQNAYVLGEEFATLAGEPNTTSLPAGTAIRFLFSSVSGGTGQVRTDLFQYKTTGTIANTGAVIFTYVDGGASDDTITRAAGSFVTDGFTAGCKVTVTGTVSNNGSFTVKTVNALSLTLIVSEVLVAEVVSSTITTKEKLLRTNESQTFSNMTSQLIQFFYTDSAEHIFALDDRIVLKWWGRRTSAGGSNTITIGTEGTASTSYIQTTLPINGSIVNTTGTTAQFNTALTDNDFATVAGIETLTNKTLSSPTFTGTPTAPTAVAGTNTTQLATTAFAQNAVNSDTKWTLTGIDLKNNNAGNTTIGVPSFGFTYNYGLGVQGKVAAGNGFIGNAYSDLNEYVMMTSGGSGAVIFHSTIRLKKYTVATLPTGTQGDTAYVTDALAPSYLGALTGGGAVVCPVFYDGVSWKSC